MIYFKTYSIKLYYLLIISTLLIENNCAPLQGDSEATILYYDYENDGTGNYNFRFGTSNNIIREETGTLVDVGLPNEHIDVKGFYSYVNANGEIVTLHYTANENGYTIVPTPGGSFSAPISPAVLASLLGK